MTQSNEVKIIGLFGELTDKFENSVIKPNLQWDAAVAAIGDFKNILEHIIDESGRFGGRAAPYINSLITASDVCSSWIEVFANFRLFEEKGCVEGALSYFCDVIFNEKHDDAHLGLYFNERVENAKSIETDTLMVCLEAFLIVVWNTIEITDDVNNFIERTISERGILVKQPKESYRYVKNNYSCVYNYYKNYFTIAAKKY